jgi:hypothetical protein
VNQNEMLAMQQAAGMQHPQHMAPQYQQVMPQMPMSDPRMMANSATAGFNQTYQPPADPSQQGQQGQQGQPMNIAPQETMQAKLARMMMQGGGGQADQQAMPAATGDLY